MSANFSARGGTSISVGRLAAPAFGHPGPAQERSNGNTANRATGHNAVIALPASDTRRGPAHRYPLKLSLRFPPTRFRQLRRVEIRKPNFYPARRATPNFDAEAIPIAHVNHRAAKRATGREVGRSLPLVRHGFTGVGLSRAGCDQHYSKCI